MEDFIKIIESLIELNRRHVHYPYTVSLAEKYLKLFTGENIDTLLRQFALRETDQMFAQRKRLYSSVMPAVANNLKTVFNKGLRSSNVYASIDPKNIDQADKSAVQEVKDKATSFYAIDNYKGIEGWLDTVWFDLAIYDPNAFEIVDFKPFDNTEEKASPFPVVFSSEESLDFLYIQNELQYFIGRKKIKMNVKKGKPVDGFKYFVYTENEVIVYTQIDSSNSSEDLTDKVVRTVGKNKLKFIVEINSHNTGKVPAIRAGVKYNPVHNRETCLSIFDPAVAFFEKELKSGSELDLTMAFHAFPQKIVLGTVCPGDTTNNIKCKNGFTVGGDTCSICKGTGVTPIHTSAQDAIVVPPPARPDDPRPDITKFIAYVTPSIELIKFQNEYVDNLTEKARKALFGGTSFIQKQSKSTATEADYAMDDIYDGLYEFLNKYSAMWIFNFGIIARQTDHKDDVVLYHKFMSDLKLKSTAQLYDERKAAKDAGAPDYVLNYIDQDILEQQYRDDQLTLNKLKIQNTYIPFKGKTPEVIQQAISRGSVPKETEIMYLYSDIIFKNIELDERYGNEFYLSSPDKQKEIIKAEIDKIIENLNMDFDTTAIDFTE